eukprot:8154001-Pyramimonas_sp.AAC.1
MGARAEKGRGADLSMLQWQVARGRRGAPLSASPGARGRSRYARYSTAAVAGGHLSSAAASARRDVCMLAALA